MNKLKILVIEDDQIMRELIRDFLKEKNFDIIAKNDGKEALDWLEGNLPDLIICDIQMPNIDGKTFLRKVRQRGFTKRTPVVILSGSQNKSEDRIAFYQEGAQDFLIKPFNPYELLEVVKKNISPLHYDYDRKW